MPASAYVELATLKAWLEGKALTLPTEMWVALTEEEPKRTDTGETLKTSRKELEYTGYARTKIKIEAGTFEFTEGGEATLSKAVNTAAIEMKVNSGADEKDNAVWYALCEKEKASEKGKVFFYGKLTLALKVQPSLSKVEFEAKKLEVTSE